MYALPVELNDYADDSTTPLPGYLTSLAAETRQTQDSPQMLTGPAAARLLELLVFATQAQRVLEIGTFTGHSALAMAGALSDGGEVITCELDPGRAQFARDHVDASPYGSRIDIRVGPALDTIASLRGPFDLVFIDADKPGYPGYVDAVLPLLAPRGLIVLDNTLLGGDVLDPAAAGSAGILRALNARLASDDKLISVLLPVRDGMTVVRKA